MNNIFYPIERYSSWTYFENYGDLFDGFSNVPTKTGTAVRARTPVTDVSETDTAYLVEAELPGILKEDLDVTINDGYLLIEAKKKDHTEKSGKSRVIRQESSIGKFARSLRLGHDVNEQEVTAQYLDGLLKVTLPKIKETQPRKVEVNVA